MSSKFSLSNGENYVVCGMCMWNHMCLEPINNKELTSFSLRDFLSRRLDLSLFACSSSPQLYHHESVPSSTLQIRSLTKKKYKVKIICFHSASILCIMALESSTLFPFATQTVFPFNTIFLLARPFACQKPIHSFPVAAKLSHHPGNSKHTWMRSFLNPRQLNSVLLVSLVQTGPWNEGIIRIYILLQHHSTPAALPPRLLLLFPKPKCKQAKIILF